MRYLFIILISFFVQSQTEVSGTISSDTTWSLNNSPYVITADILVDNGVTLTIEPGVSILANPITYIKCLGTVKAIGNEQNKITFDTNSSTEIWGGIKIRPTGGSTIDSNNE